VAKLRLEEDANAEGKDNKGSTAWDMARDEGSSQIAELLESQWGKPFF
jgi:hypothetical protein